MIEKSALLILRGDWPNNELLLVREYNKPYWLFPGGKPEPGETIEEALVREINEELSTEATDFKSIGTLDGHTPDGVPLRIHLFSGSIEDEIVPSSEIETLRWLQRIDLESVTEELTPITIQKVLPFLREHQIW